MGFEDRGEPVRLEFSSADVTIAAEITLWDGNSIARPLAEEERLIILSLSIHAAAAVTTLALFDDLDEDGNVDAGEKLFYKSVAAALAFSISYEGEGQSAGKGRMPKVKAGVAGTVDITGNGYIIKG